MLFQSNPTWQWFCKKPLFQRILLFIPIIIVVLIIGIILILFKRDFDLSSTSIDPIGTIKKQQEKFYKNKIDKIKEKDKELMDKINKETEKRRNIIEKQKNRNKEMRKKHAAINKSNSISGVDNVLKRKSKQKRNRRR